MAALAGTALLQAGVVVASGSVALLSDTLHNLSDAGTALPLLLAFRLGRRRPSRRFSYGLGRAEDLAGIVIVAHDRRLRRPGRLAGHQPPAPTPSRSTTSAWWPPRP